MSGFQSSNESQSQKETEAVPMEASSDQVHADYSCVTPSVHRTMDIASGSSDYASSATNPSVFTHPVSNPSSLAQSGSNPSAFVPSASSYQYGDTAAAGQGSFDPYQYHSGQMGYPADPNAVPHGFTALMASQYPNYLPTATAQQCTLPEPTRSLQSDSGNIGQSGSDECGGKSMREYTPSDCMRSASTAQQSGGHVTHVEASDSDASFVRSAFIPGQTGSVFGTPSGSGLFTAPQSQSGNLFDAPHPPMFEQNAGDDVSPGRDECDSSNKCEPSVNSDRLTDLANIACEVREKEARVNAENTGEKEHTGEAFTNWDRKQKVRKVKNYEACQLKWAIFAVQQKRLNTSEASRLFRIPRKTLADKVKAFSGQCPLTQDTEKAPPRSDSEIVSKTNIPGDFSSHDKISNATQSQSTFQKRTAKKYTNPLTSPKNKLNEHVPALKGTEVTRVSSCTLVESNPQCMGASRRGPHLGLASQSTFKESSGVYTMSGVQSNPQVSHPAFGVYTGVCEAPRPASQTQDTYPSMSHQQSESQRHFQTPTFPIHVNPESSHYDPVLLTNSQSFNRFPAHFPPSSCSNTTQIPPFYGHLPVFDQSSLPISSNDIRLPFSLQNFTSFGPEKSAFQAFPFSGYHRNVIATEAEVLASHRNAIATEAEVLASHRNAIATEAEVLASHRNAIATEAEVLASHRNAIATEAEVLASHRNAIATEAEVLASHRSAISTEAEVLASHRSAISTGAEVLASHRSAISTGAEVLASHINAVATGAEVLASSNNLHQLSNASTNNISVNTPRTENKQEIGSVQSEKTQEVASGVTPRARHMNAITTGAEVLASHRSAIATGAEVLASHSAIATGAEVLASHRNAIATGVEALARRSESSEQRDVPQREQDSSPAKYAKRVGGKAKRTRSRYERVLLDSAVRAVQSGLLIPSVAARIFQVPRRTICDRVKSRKDPMHAAMIERKRMKDTVRRPRFDYDQASLSNAINAVRSKRRTISEAADKYRIPKNTLIGWLNRMKKNNNYTKRITVKQKRPMLRYNTQSLENAVQAVVNKRKTISQAAVDFRVNRRTLNDRVLKLKRRNSFTRPGDSPNCVPSNYAPEVASIHCGVNMEQGEQLTGTNEINTHEDQNLFIEDACKQNPEGTEAQGKGHQLEALQSEIPTRPENVDMEASEGSQEMQNDEMQSRSSMCKISPREEKRKRKGTLKTANSNDEGPKKKRSRYTSEQKRSRYTSEQERSRYTSEQLQEAVTAVKSDALTVGQAARKYHIPKRTLFDHTMYDVCSKVTAGGDVNHKKPRKKYTKEHLNLALNEVQDGSLSITQAAQKYGIPRRTLFDRAMGKTKDIECYDKKTLHLELSVQEESGLVRYTQQLQDIGQWFRMKDFKLNVLEMAERSGKPHRFNVETGPTYLWIRRFFSRHREFDPNKANDVHNLVVKGSFNPTCVSSFMQFYGDMLTSNGLMHKPAQIFDCAQVYFGKESRTQQKQVATHEEVSAHMCVSASGRCLPVCMVYQQQLPKSDTFQSNIAQNWLMETSPTGEMDRTIFLLWFEKVFLRHCGDSRPVLLTLDNSESLLSLKVLDLAVKNQVQLVVLPSQWSRHLQPLSLRPFGSLLTSFCQLATQSKLADLNNIMASEKLPELLKRTVETSCTEDIVRQGFRQAGFFPFHPSAVNLETLKKKSNSNLRRSFKTLENAELHS